jgi:hypothetical protein
MGRGKNREYYAVFSGRVDEPTIFSSWYSTWSGDEHAVLITLIGETRIHE